MKKVGKFLDQIEKWAIGEVNILGIALVGSHARNASKEHSDIDLMIIVKNPNIYLNNNSWIDRFGKVKKDGVQNEDWGLVKTKRVFYENGIEAEFNITTEEWTKTNPVDKGTEKLMNDGNKILVDKERLLEKLISPF